MSSYKQVGNQTLAQMNRRNVAKHSTYGKAYDVAYPQYTVNGKTFGSDFEQANMYFNSVGGVLMEKLDSMTPAHVLKSTKSMS